MKELIAINRVGSHRNNRFKGQVVVGPTYGVHTASRKRWMARSLSETGDKNVPQDAIFLKNITTASADHHEASGGCSSRAAGVFCSHKEISQQNLVPLNFNVGSASFRTQDGQYVDPRYVALLADGSVMGAL